MLFLSILITLTALSAIIHKARGYTPPENTVYYGDGLLNAGIPLMVAMAAALWIFPSWWLVAPALLSTLPFLLWRNCRITWGRRTFTVSGLLGLKWTFDNAAISSVCGAFLRVGWHVFFLWPGTYRRSAFIDHARQQTAIAKRDAKYRKSKPESHRENRAAWGKIAANALIIALVLLLAVLGREPITSESGRVYEVTLRSARLQGETLRLDFGLDHGFRLTHADDDHPLLDESAVGDSFTVQATRVSVRRGRYGGRTTYYKIHALRGADGRVYRTVEESEALRIAAIPNQLLTYASMGLLLIFADTQPLKRKRQK